MQRLVWMLFLSMLFLLCPAPQVAAQLPPMPDLGLTLDALSVVKSAKGGGVLDMEQMTVRVVAWGTCDPKEAATDAECIATAYAVAKANGMQNLSEIVGDLDIGMGYTSNGINAASGETIIRSEAFLKGVKEIPGVSPNDVPYRGYHYMPDNSIVAWMSLKMPLQGVALGVGLDNPTLRNLLEERIKERSQEIKAQSPPASPPTPAGAETPSVPTPTPQVSPPPTRQQPASDKAFTGLILDGSALPTQPTVLAPAVLNASGDRVLDHNRFLRSVRLNGESFRYARSLEKARAYRDKVGANPLVVTVANAYNDGVLVVSDEDARRVAAADQEGNFLRFGRVIIVY